ncbi:HAD-IA family hydrolase [Paenibacillus sp. NPDC058071]|uniref:HAD-IA family hydrolase n=1 Tax=Paenibacillus sp. NPDC058071 TaxID=3346326 RepID=UPI0036DEC8F2
MSFAVIFDMDGTLFQTDKILEPALEDTFTRLREQNRWNRETPIETYRQIMGVPLPVVWEHLMPEHAEDERQQANEQFQSLLITQISAGRGALYPEVEEILADLKRNGFELYIASNGLVAYLQAITDYYQLDRWVTETFSIEHIPSQHKSDLVQAIKRKYGIRHGAVVGDRLSDIKAAQDNGLVSIGCHFYFAQPDELAHADHVIRSFSELKTILNRLKQQSVQ